MSVSFIIFGLIRLHGELSRRAASVSVSFIVVRLIRQGKALKAGREAPPFWVCIFTILGPSSHRQRRSILGCFRLQLRIISLRKPLLLLCLPFISSRVSCLFLSMSTFSEQLRCGTAFTAASHRHRLR